MHEPIIKITDLVVKYDGRVVLDSLNLDIFQGESIAILGKSGCGKSTLLRHIIGLNRPATGQILIRGQDITLITEDERVKIFKKVGMLFQ